MPSARLVFSDGPTALMDYRHASVRRVSPTSNLAGVAWAWSGLGLGQNMGSGRILDLGEDTKHSNHTKYLISPIPSSTCCTLPSPH